MYEASKPPLNIPQTPPGGKPQGNAGGLQGAGTATSHPAPPGGSVYPGGPSCTNVLSTAGTSANARPPSSSTAAAHAPPLSAGGGQANDQHQEVGPKSQPRPLADRGGGSGVWGQRPQGYLEPIAKDAIDTEGPPTLTLHQQEGQQLTFSDACPGWATVGTCPKGHRYAKELSCGREWCPTCQEENSVAHNRRMARWLPKARQLSQMGYLVITLPQSVRWQLENKPHLRYAYDRIIDVLAGKRCGRRGRVGAYFPRGLARWHWYGEQAGVFHPHLNALVEGGYIGRHKLRELRRHLASALHTKDLVINYQFTRDTRKMLHWLKYTTRATMLSREWAPDFADNTLYNFRNARYWGNWGAEAVWELPEATAPDSTAISALEDSTCPRCGGHVEWTRPKRLCDVQALLPLTPIGAGYYEVTERSPPE